MIPEELIPDDINVENAADYVDRVIPYLDEKPPEQKYGRGVVTCAGGHCYQINAWVMINMLRKVGCTLPIQAWYLGERERNRAWEKLVEPLGVECINAYDYLDKYPHKRLYGWELKLYAIMHSPFAEVLFLDADNVAVRDPTYLFDDPYYEDYGAVFWPDGGRLGPERLAWKVFGNIPYRDEWEVESGQLVINKIRCWKALELGHWYMQNSNNFFFHHVYGDKEVFHLSWRKLGMKYAMPRKHLTHIGWVINQYDLAGELIFQHRTRSKWSFYDNFVADGIHHQATILDLIEDLKTKWSPASQELPTEEDKRETKLLHGAKFLYDRIGYDRRPIRLSASGTFIAGGARMEWYWAYRNGKIYVSGDDGLTMILEPRNNRWEGQWLIHEKMPVRWIPLD